MSKNRVPKYTTKDIISSKSQIETKNYSQIRSFLGACMKVDETSKLSQKQTKLAMMDLAKNKDERDFIKNKFPGVDTRHVWCDRNNNMCIVYTKKTGFENKIVKMFFEEDE